MKGLFAFLFIGACAYAVQASDIPKTAVPTAVPLSKQDTYWAGKDFWNRRHAAKLAEIASGSGEYDFVFIGDSITHNWEGWTDPIDVNKVTAAYEAGTLRLPNGPGRVVYEEMKREFKLLNLGFGGDSTQNVLWRLEHGELDGYRTRGVMLMVGTNNRESPEEIAAGVKAVLDKIAEKQPTARTILLPIFPCMKSPDNDWRKRNEAVNGIIRGFADGEKVVWCDFNAQFLEADGILSEEMMPDLLHPMEKGYRIWRAAVEPTMRAIIAESKHAVGQAGVFGGAQWIAAREGRACNPAFRRDFAVTAPVKKAELNICGLGYQVSSVNGRRVGESELDPVPSDYRRRVYYSTYDVTPLVRVGTNRLEVLLGHGWYDFVERDNWDFDKAGWRDRPKLIAALTLVYGDGRRETVATDSSWRRIGSPVRYDAVRSGIEETGPVEEIDDPVDVTTGPAGRLMKTDCPPTKVRRTLSAVRSRDLGRGAWLFDFGEEIAGRVRLRMRGLSRGDLVKVRYDERVNDDFTPTTNRVIDTYFKDTTRELQTDSHHASGLPEEEFAPRFTYKGFRYVLVTGAKAPIRSEDIRAEELQTAFRTTGSFVCSDEDFNELLRMADRSYRANFVNGVPTDCPQREKNGWLGDANLAGEFAAYVYDNHAAMRKWLRDIVDAQRPTGEIPGIAPTDTWGFKRYGGTTDETLVHLAGLRARFTGDRSVLSELYPAIVRNLDFRLANHVRPNGTVDEGIGDWCPAKSRTDNTFVSSALFYGAIRKTAAAARLLGKSEDAARYEARAEQMKEAVNRVCYKGSGVYANGTQTAQALALFHGFVPASDREQALAALVRAIHAADDHVDFGIVGASTVFRVLSENGLTDLAYKMIVQPTAPGFLSWRNRGGTCLWEDFDDGFSRCHVMFADFVAWAYAYLAGIRGIEDGYARFVLAPQPIAALDHVTAKVETPRGSVTSAWRREGDRIRYRFTVPDGARAILRLPGRRDECVGGGEYER